MAGTMEGPTKGIDGEGPESFVGDILFLSLSCSEGGDCGVVFGADSAGLPSIVGSLRSSMMSWVPCQKLLNRVFRIPVGDCTGK